MGPCHNPMAATAAGNRFHDGGLDVRRCLGRGHVDRLLEERPIERIWFVEDCEDIKLAVVHHTLDGKFPALDERLDEHDIVGLVPFDANVRRVENGPEPLERSHEACSIVGAHDAPAARESHGFDDAWK